MDEWRLRDQFHNSLGVADDDDCYVRLANESSLTMHDRLGFRRIGVMTAVALPWLRWLRFDAPPVSQQWVVPFRGELRLPMPPVPPPASLGLA